MSTRGEREVFSPKRLRSISYKVTKTTTQQMYPNSVRMQAERRVRGEKSNYRLCLRIGSLSRLSLFLPFPIWLIAYLRVAYITCMVLTDSWLFSSREFVKVNDISITLQTIRNLQTRNCGGDHRVPCTSDSPPFFPVRSFFHHHFRVEKIRHASQLRLTSD